MIPKQLTIQGLNSYKSSQNIDFETLTQAQLFGIFGATGSGKSSILEAITFSLYGESERLNARDSRAYNMMNLGSDMMQIHFEFWAGKEGKELFKAEVVGKRNKKKFEDVKMERFLNKWDGEKWIPIGVEKIEEVIGLDHANFCKTIIIPQGKFQKFIIDMTDGERTDMLKKIFNLYKFDLTDKTKKVEQKYTQLFIEKDALFQKIADINPELVQQAESDLQTQKELATQLATQVHSKELEIRKLADLQNIFKKVLEKRKELEDLTAKTTDFGAREKRLEEYEYCLREFAPILEQNVNLFKKIEKTQAIFQSKQQLFTRTKNDLDSTEKLFQNISKQYESRHELTKKIEQLDKILHLRSLKDNMEALAERKDKGTQKINEKKQEVEQDKLQIQTLNRNIDEKQGTKGNLRVLIEIKDWFIEAEKRENEVLLVQNQIEECLSIQKDLHKQKHKLLENVGISALQFELPIAKLQEVLKGEKENLTLQEEKQKENLRIFSVKVALKDYAAALQEGEACPLCGSLHHAKVETIENWEGHVAQTQKEIKNLSQQLKKTELVISQLGDLQKRLTENEEKQTILQKKLLHNQQQSEIWQKEFEWKNYQGKDKTDIESEILFVHKQEAEIKDWQEKKAVLEKDKQKCEEELDKYKTVLDEILQKYYKFESDFHAGKNLLTEVKWDDYEGRGKADIQAETDKTKAELKGREALYLKTKENLQQLQTAVDTLHGEIVTLEKQKREAEKEQSELKQTLAEKILFSPFGTEAKVQEILGRNINIESEKKAFLAFRASLNAVKQTLSELELQIHGKSFDESHFLQLKSDFEALKKQESEVLQAIGALNEQWEALKVKLAEKIGLEKELTKLEAKRKNIALLKKMFSGDGFVQFVLTTFIQNICTIANNRFSKLTQGTLQLEPAQGTAFQVRDFLNNGQTRSIKTLSGGQTFQAALSLALALADSVQKQVQSDKNFFFIDEGFGSQDKESLRIIFETLHALRKENRIVGIISHVEELQQEIGAFLRITNDKEKGSKVEASWVC